MRFVVVITSAFEDAVVDVVGRLADVSAVYAGRVGADCRRTMLTLDENPRRGRSVPEMDDERLRQLTVANGAFRLMYFVNVESRIVTLIDFQPTQRFDPTKLLAAVRHFDL
jgi:hypothetical protein